MGDTSHFGELGLIAQVTAALAGANTRRILLQRTAEVLKAHLPLSLCQMGWLEGDGLFSTAAIAYRDGGQLRELEGVAPPLAVLSRVRRGETVVESGEHQAIVVAIPLPDGDGWPGYLQISLSHAADDLLSHPILEALACLLGFAQRHCRLVERMARLSSDVQHERESLRQELRRYTEPAPIAARSESMRRVVESAGLVAGHDTAVLIRGESGTGKEVLARHIHRLSKRARHPFIAVNCGALPEALIESELFGHERGAFTGATGRYRGRFERANHGTIFLDEIGELPPPAQVKLLRVLQDGEFEPLGGELVVRANVRVIAATNRNLESMVEQGVFRLDLFYRINIFPILIPPLRERSDDIPLLAQNLLVETAKRLGCKTAPLSPEAIRQLAAWHWPGNVRELANAIERALIVSQGRPPDFSTLSAGTSAVASRAETAKETFDDAARRAILAALQACDGRIYGKRGAAQRLGMPPSTLQGKMRKLQITSGAFR
jgi:transcriptional regulator with GAF, ATPase, and Fis domain